MQTPRTLVACAALAAVCAACGSDLEPITGCDPAGGIEPICGFQNPEDLALLPDGMTLLVSQFGSMDGSRMGNLAAYDVKSRALRPLYAGAAGKSPMPDVAAGPRWGDRDCSEPQAIAPHGIDLARRPDGALALLVVNHHARESVEMFEVSGSGRRLALEWRGCAIPPEGSYLNDVVALPDGGFLATHMMDKQGQFLGLVRAVIGFDSGHVLEWQPDRGFSVLPGSGARMPNGIEVSEDGETVFVNVYIGSEVRRIDRASGRVTGVAQVPSPDNLSWASDGRLLVASHDAPLRDQLACSDLQDGSCPFSFSILALDPDTLETEVLVANEGAPMGAGTVALEVGSDLYIGTFAGDRIARAPLR